MHHSYAGYLPLLVMQHPYYLWPEVIVLTCNLKTCIMPSVIRGRTLNWRVFKNSCNLSVFILPQIFKVGVWTATLNDHGKFDFRYAKEQHPNYTYRHFPWQQQSNPRFFSFFGGVRCFHKPLRGFIALTALFVSIFFPPLFCGANKLKAAESSEVENGERWQKTEEQNWCVWSNYGSSLD